MSRIEEMEDEVAERRAALLETARALQARLQPSRLATNAWEATKAKGVDLAEDAVDAVRARPVAAGGAVAALALFLAREPVKAGITSLVGKTKARARKAKSTDKKAPPRVEEPTKTKSAPARAPARPATRAKAKARGKTGKATT